MKHITKTKHALRAIHAYQFKNTQSNWEVTVRRIEPGKWIVYKSYPSNLPPDLQQDILLQGILTYSQAVKYVYSILDPVTISRSK
jgi:hypothetical protein